MAFENYIIKVVIAGDTGVGKSALLEVFTEVAPYSRKHAPPALHIPTIGLEFGNRIVNIAGKYVKLQCWDIAGQENFHSITRSYFRGAGIVVLAFDITSSNSFRHLEAWLCELSNQGVQTDQIILVGTKADLTDQHGKLVQRQVSLEDAQDWALENLGSKDAYIEVSATSANADHLKQTLLVAITAKVKTVISGIDTALTTRYQDDPQGQVEYLKDLEQKGVTRSSQSSARAPAAVASSSGTLIIPTTHSSSSRNGFGGIFSSRTSAPAPNPYVLTLAPGHAPTEDQIAFTEDFKAIFRCLLNESWFGKRDTQAAQAVLSTEALNEDALGGHAMLVTRPRTAQTITILKQLRQIEYGYGHGESSKQCMGYFLRDFKDRYLENYRQGFSNGMFSRSAGVVDWVHQTTHSVDAMSSEQLRTCVIEVLCHAEANPRSRTAGVVQSLRDDSSYLQTPTHSHS